MQPVFAADADSSTSSDPSSNSTDSATASPSSDANSSQFDGDLSNLENRFFYHTYQNEPPEKRLDRLERLVFGSRKSGTVQQRITALLLDVPSLNDDSDASQATPSSASNTMPATAPTFSYHPQVAGQSLVSEVSAMEQEVYGKTYGSDTLINRVNRLEKTVFPNDTKQTFTSITSRVNRLVQALQPKFSAPSLSTVPDSDSWTDTKGSGSGDDDKSHPEKKKGHPFLHKLGHFIGDVGEVAGMAAAGVAAGSMMGYGYGYGYGGWGYPGMGWGYPGMGMGWGYRPYMW